MSRQNITDIFISFFLFLLLAGLGNYWITALGIGLWLYTFLRFLNNLGRSIPILNLMLLMATSQWILGAWFAYNLEFQHYKYFMYVDEQRYMDFVVPGTFALVIGTNLGREKPQQFNVVYENLVVVLRNYGKIPYYLIAIGFLAPYLSFIVPPALRFVLFLLANLKYIGVIYLLFQGGKQSTMVLWIVLLLTFISSVQAGMFHDFLLWSGLMITFLALRYQWNIGKKLLFIILGIITAFSIQLVKQELRSVLSESGKEQAVPIFFDLVQEELEKNDDMFSDEQLGELNVRLNQGWIISSIMENVPNVENFAKGETIREALRASIIPRIFDPNKKIAGGRENFRRFTGLAIGGSTSMGTSIIGEAYANYGEKGTWLFMFIWGFALALILRMLIWYSYSNPTFILWLPLIYLQVIKAETEVVVVLNHLVKAGIFTLGLFWITPKFLGRKI